MKKSLKYFFLLLVVCSMIPFSVLADCGVNPIFLEATVSNPDGAKLYKIDIINGESRYVLTEKTLNYGEEFTIGYEHMGYASIDGVAGSYYIKASDYSYKKEKKVESENYKKYYAYEETIIKNVPSIYSYDVVDKIPANTYFDGSVSGLVGKWLAVSYNGKTGWVYIGGCSLEGEKITIANKYQEPIQAYVLGIKNYKDKTYEDVTVGYSILGDDSTKKDISIKRGDKVEILYDHRLGHNNYHYIKTDSIDGIWVYNVNFYIENNENVIIFEKSDDNDDYEYVVKDFYTLSTVDVSFENYKIYNYKYELFGIEGDEFVIDMDGKLYLISNTINYAKLKKDPVDITLNDDYTYYSKDLSTSESYKLGTISKGDYSAYKSADKDDIYFIPEYGFVEYKFDESNDNGDKVIDTETISPITYVSYCVVGTIALALIAGMIIILVNRKKVSKKEEK